MTAEQERERIVAWLRESAYERWCISDDDGEATLTNAADAIEAREHLTGGQE